MGNGDENNNPFWTSNGKLGQGVTGTTHTSELVRDAAVRARISASGPVCVFIS